MIKSGLKLYRDNIFEAFAIIGVVAIGVLIGILVTTPILKGVIENNISEIIATATTIPGKFDKNTFIVEFTKHLNQLDWSNPIRTIKILFEQDGLLNIIKTSLESANFDMSKFSMILDDVQKCTANILTTLTNQAVIFITITGIFGLGAYILTRLFIKIRSTSNQNILLFILSIISNLVLLVITFVLIIVFLYYLTGPTFYIVLISSLIVLLIISLLVSILIYKKKEIKFTQMFNLKTLLMLLLSAIIVLGISSLIIIPVLIFSELIGILIAIPLLIVTNIIIENIAINYVTEFDNRKKRNNKEVSYEK